MLPMASPKPYRDAKSVFTGRKTRWGALVTTDSEGSQRPSRTSFETMRYLPQDHALAKRSLAPWSVLGRVSSGPMRCKSSPKGSKAVDATIQMDDGDTDAGQALSHPWNARAAGLVNGCPHRGRGLRHAMVPRAAPYPAFYQLCGRDVRGHHAIRRFPFGGAPRPVVVPQEPARGRCCPKTCAGAIGMSAHESAPSPYSTDAGRYAG